MTPVNRNPRERCSGSVNRPDLDRYFMSIAKCVAERSTCLRHKIGAVLVYNKRIVATGYNGAPTGMIHCCTTGCLRDKLNIPSGEQAQVCRAVHAEQNAILQAVGAGASLVAASLYCTHHPCIICAKLLTQVGVSMIIYETPYADRLSAEFLAEAGIAVRCLQDA